MNVRKFIAATARDALHKVKELLGPDAIILSNRAVPGGVEIMAVAAGDMDMILPAATPAPAPVARPEEGRVHDDYRGRAAAPAPAAARSSASPLLTPRPAPQIERSEAPKAQAEIVPAEVMDEIRSLRKMFEQHLAGAAWGEAARSEPVKTEILRQMLDAGF